MSKDQHAYIEGLSSWSGDSNGYRTWGGRNIDSLVAFLDIEGAFNNIKTHAIKSRSKSDR